MRGIVSRVVELLEDAQVISSTEVARVAGISRQAAHKQLRHLVSSGVICAEGEARARRYRRVAPKVAHEEKAAPLHTHLEVAAAGSLFRLSARLLLDGVTSGAVTLDFTGVFDVGDEFLEEVFSLLSPSHERIKLRVVHLPARFAPRFFELARRARELTEAPQASRAATVLATRAPDRRRRRA